MRENGRSVCLNCGSVGLDGSTCRAHDTPPDPSWAGVKRTPIPEVLERLERAEEAAQEARDELDQLAREVLAVHPVDDGSGGYGSVGSLHHRAKAARP